MTNIDIFHRFEQYVRHSYSQGPVLGYPKNIAAVWSGWPDGVWFEPSPNDEFSGGSITAPTYYPDI